MSTSVTCLPVRYSQSWIHLFRKMHRFRSQRSMQLQPVQAAVMISRQSLSESRHMLGE